jgi:hypothetical protein
VGNVLQTLADAANNVSIIAFLTRPEQCLYFNRQWGEFDEGAGHFDLDGVST